MSAASNAMGYREQWLDEWRRRRALSHQEFETFKERWLEEDKRLVETQVIPCLMAEVERCHRALMHAIGHYERNMNEYGYLTDTGGEAGMHAWNMHKTLVEALEKGAKFHGDSGYHERRGVEHGGS